MSAFEHLHRAKTAPTARMGSGTILAIRLTQAQHTEPNPIFMLRNYFLIAVRNFWKQKHYTLLNVGGLAVAIATAILALLFVRHEYSYDHWMPNQEQVYKVYRQWPEANTSYTPYLLSGTLRDEFPEVVNATWVKEYNGVLMGAENQEGVFADKIAAVDSSFLQVLMYPLRYGNAKNALERPHTAVLSSQTAHKLFGEEDPVGRIVRLNASIDYEVTGVLAPLPGNSHIEVDALIRDTTYLFPSWIGNNLATYVSVHPRVEEVSALEDKITAAINPRLRAQYEENGIEAGQYPDWKLQPLQEVHLSAGEINGPFSGHGEKRSVQIVALVALVIVVIASINYMNMATAQATRRAQEVGIRKVTGAYQSQLIGQFLIEATLQCLLALPVAVLLTELALPAFERIVSRDLPLNVVAWIQLLPYLLLFTIILGLLSGSYPAFLLSRYRPTTVLKGKGLRDNQGKLLRQTLIVVQFSGAIAVAIVMFFIYQQIRFMQNQELGFQDEQVMVITVNTQDTYRKVSALKPKLLQNPQVKAVTSAVALPGMFYPDFYFQLGGQDHVVSSVISLVDPDYIKVLDLEMQAGRFLSDADTSTNTFVVNETFVRQHQLTEPIGHSINIPPATDGKIIGVVKDFNFSSLERKIQPLVFSGAINSLWGGMVNTVAVRLQTTHLRETISEVEGFWQQVEPSHPIRYTFLDDDFAGLYAEQERLGQTLLYATFITLFIALLGLFGLASYVAERRTKEIGVRKVLGASVQQIVTLLGVDFLKVVVLSGLVAAPIAWWLTRRWLADFAYRTEITLVPFVVAIILAIVVAVLTVSVRAVRAALANPVDSLRSE